MNDKYFNVRRVNQDEIVFNLMQIDNKEKRSNLFIVECSNESK